MVGRERVEEVVHQRGVGGVASEFEGARVADHLRQVKVGVREGQLRQVVVTGGERRGEDPAWG